MQHSAYPERFSTWRELRELAFADAKAVASGEPAGHLSDVQRRILATGRPSEELYDEVEDPFELMNLADDPHHAAALEELRGRLDAWQAAHANPWPPHEAELIESWRPGGQMQRTATPVLTEQGQGRLGATCETPGASIGWTTESPRAPRTRSEMEVMTGAPSDDGRRWQLYTGPICPPTEPVRFGAWRLGFEPSDEVIWPPEGPHGRGPV